MCYKALALKTYYSIAHLFSQLVFHFGPNITNIMSLGPVAILCSRALLWN